MAWVILILIIATGIVLVFVEIIFVPGTTIVGMFGLIFIIGGVWYGFSTFGESVGWTISSVTFILLIVVIVIGFKSGVWNRFALNKSIDSKVNEHIPITIDVGDEGIAVSALRPIGNAEFGNDKMEVTTLGELVDSSSKVVVTNIEGKVIYVKQINS